MANSGIIFHRQAGKGVCAINGKGGRSRAITRDDVIAVIGGIALTDGGIRGKGRR